MIALTPEQRQTVERRFHDLATQWLELTHYRSNLGALRDHPVYRDLAALGQPVVPLILRELERRPSAAWFGLLAEITGDHPVPAESAGIVSAMADS
jgi:hypothetical protein